MIAVNDTVELKATITAVGGNNFDIAVSEIYVDSEWQKFTVPKALNVLLADYDATALSETEKALFKTLVVKYATTLTGDDVAIANSVKAKLV